MSDLTELGQEAIAAVSLADRPANLSDDGLEPAGE
jgi:hypothetical protein